MAARRRARWPWLVAGLVVLVVGAWLMAGVDPPPPPERPDVSLPRRMQRDEEARNTKRRTWVPLIEVDAGVVAPAPVPASDPVLAALPPKVEFGAVVVEANAIRNSDLGPLFVDCVFAGDDRVLDVLRDAGIDPLSQVDRVAVADSTLIVSGDFRQANVEALLPAKNATGYGRQGTLYELPGSDGGVQATFATWAGQMMVVGSTPEEAKAAIDRLEGVGPRETPVLGDDQAYGEVYGVLQASALSDVLAKEDPALAQKIRDAASAVRLHADITRDVGLVADVEGNDPAKSEELRKALGSALSLAQLEAKARGREEAAEVLELARVRAAQEGGADFRLEAGLPYEFMEKVLKQCAEQGKERRARRAERRAASLDAGVPLDAPMP